MAGRIALGAKDMAIAVKDPVAGTFAAMLDAPGLASFSINYEGDVEELRGDDLLLASVAKSVTASGSFELGIQDLAVKAALTGGTVVVSGTGNTAVTTLLVPSTPKMPLAQLAAIARGVGTDGGTLLGRVYQGRVTNGGGFELTDGYATSSYDFTALDFNGSVFAIEQYAASIATVPSAAVSVLPA
jgi:hypothetical protein